MALNESTTPPPADLGPATPAPTARGRHPGWGTVLPLARRFPLRPSPSPACLELEERIAAEVVGPARADLASSKESAIARARIALDRAVVIAADCHRPEVAVDLCWRHLDIYSALDTPLSVTTATALLEPTRNLARLMAQQGQTDQAVSLVTDLAHAVRTGAPVFVNTIGLPRIRVQAAPKEHQRWVQYATSGLLADAIKAYALAERWADAVALAEELDAPSPHLSEPRQALILASLIKRDLPRARQYLAGASFTEQWEAEIASCLAVLIAAPSDRLAAAEDMLTAFRKSVYDNHFAAYRARYGTTVTLLAQEAGHAGAAWAGGRVVAGVLDLCDGYGALEVLRHLPGSLSAHDARALEDIVDRSGLAGQRLTDRLLTMLWEAADEAAATLEEAMY